MILELCFRCQGTAVPVIDTEVEDVIRILRKHPQTVLRGREVLIPQGHGREWFDVQLHVGQCDEVLRPLGRRFLRLEGIPL